MTSEAATQDIYALIQNQVEEIDDLNNLIRELLCKIFNARCSLGTSYNELEKNKNLSNQP